MSISNMQDPINHTTRSMIVAATIGGAVSVASQWKARQANEISSDEFLKTAAKDTLKAGALSGVGSYISEKTTSHSILTLTTVLAASAAGVYMLEKRKGASNE